VDVTENDQVFISNGLSPTPGGFSLAEMLVAILILAATAAVAAPSMDRLLEGYRVRAVARQLASDLQAVKMNAVARHAACSIRFNAGGTNQYQMYAEGNSTGTARCISDKTNPFYAAGVLVCFPRPGQREEGSPAVIFTSLGTAGTSAGTIKVVAASAARDVIVASTGRVRIAVGK
jgi:prepilin-type N-terminal cleavage/methylation domain-containing protein